MVQLQRCLRLAALTTALTALVAPAWAQSTNDHAKHAKATEPQTAAKPDPMLDGALFYSLLLGEMATGAGDASSGYALILDAARRTGDEQLYQRATEIALQARSGDAALAAGRAWKEAHPESREANRFVWQVLIALNRIPETAEPMQRELALAPAVAKPALISAIPSMYARASDRAKAAAVVEQALKDAILEPSTATAAWISIGRMRLAATDLAAALVAAQRAHALSPTHDNMARLALELMDEGVKTAEPLVQTYLQQASPLPELQIGYARVLVGQQRLSDARQQTLAVTRNKPETAEAWLLLGTLQLEANELAPAKESLDKFIQLNSETAEVTLRERGFTQAYLLRSQLAQKQGQWAEANEWLNKVPNGDQVFAVQMRRASMLAQRGQMTEARALLRAYGGTSTEEQRLKLLAEVQLLKDARMYAEALKVQAEMVKAQPDDADLVYDQAMLAEKAGDTKTMEKLLRSLIARDPKNHHALNALGYALADRGEKLPEARALIAKALELSPNDPFITDSLGWVEFRMGNHQTALKLLQAAYDAKQDPEIAAHLGEVLWVLGDQAKAQAIWNQARAQSPDHEALRATLQRFNIR